jgi:hypothetical protein
MEKDLEDKRDLPFGQIWLFVVLEDASIQSQQEAKAPSRTPLVT